MAVASTTTVGCRRDTEGYVLVDDCGATTTSGVYAAGDLTPDSS